MTDKELEEIYKLTKGNRDILDYGFRAFGWYRIIVGAIILIALVCGIDLQMID